MNMTSEQIAQGVAKSFVAAFNQQDAEAVADTFNFPHIRLANGRFAHIESAERFVANQNLVRDSLKAENWHHTLLVSSKVVHCGEESGEEKVHLAVTFHRCHENGEVYKRTDSLWIVTRLDDHWGIQFRSSYLI